jgi:hypothetical protein
MHNKHLLQNNQINIDSKCQAHIGNGQVIENSALKKMVKLP